MLKLYRLEEAKLWFQNLWEGSYAEEMSSRQTKAMPAIFCLLYVGLLGSTHGRIVGCRCRQQSKLGVWISDRLDCSPPDQSPTSRRYKLPSLGRPERMTADKLPCSRLERRSWGEPGRGRAPSRASMAQGSSIAPPVGFWLNCFAIVMPSALLILCADAIYPEVALGVYQ